MKVGFLTFMLLAIYFSQPIVAKHHTIHLINKTGKLVTPSVEITSCPQIDKGQICGVDSQIGPELWEVVRANAEGTSAEVPLLPTRGTLPQDIDMAVGFLTEKYTPAGFNVYFDNTLVATIDIDSMGPFRINFNHEKFSMVSPSYGHFEIK